MQDFAYQISKAFRGYTSGPPWREGAPKPPPAPPPRGLPQSSIGQQRCPPTIFILKHALVSNMPQWQLVSTPNGPVPWYWVFARLSDTILWCCLSTFFSGLPLMFSPTRFQPPHSLFTDRLSSILHVCPNNFNFLFMMKLKFFWHTCVGFNYFTNIDSLSFWSSYVSNFTLTCICYMLLHQSRNIYAGI